MSVTHEQHFRIRAQASRLVVSLEVTLDSPRDIPSSRLKNKPSKKIPLQVLLAWLTLPPLRWKQYNPPKRK
jgi:hypothetical protein